MPFEQRHEARHAIEHCPLGRTLHGLHERFTLPSRRPGEGPRNLGKALEQLTEPQLGCLDEIPDERGEVVGEPRNRAELHPMGLLVQAHPEPEVARRHLQLPFDVHDGRGHEQQPALLPRLREDLVLTEHLAGEPGEHRADLQRGAPGSQVSDEGGRFAALELVEQRCHGNAHPRDIRGDPGRPVDDSGTPVARHVKARHLPDRLDRLRGEVAQHGHCLARLLPRQIGATRCEPGRRGDREAPLD